MDAFIIRKLKYRKITEGSFFTREKQIHGANTEHVETLEPELR